LYCIASEIGENSAQPLVLEAMFYLTNIARVDDLESIELP